MATGRCRASVAAQVLLEQAAKERSDLAQNAAERTGGSINQAGDECNKHLIPRFDRCARLSVRMGERRSYTRQLPTVIRHNNLLMPEATALSGRPRARLLHRSDSEGRLNLDCSGTGRCRSVISGNHLAAARVCREAQPRQPGSPVGRACVSTIAGSGAAAGGEGTVVVLDGHPSPECCCAEGAWS